MLLLFLTFSALVAKGLGGKPLSIRRAFLLAYLGINSMWKSISEKRQCSAKNRHNAQHNKHKSIRCLELLGFLMFPADTCRGFTVLPFPSGCRASRI